MLAFFACIGNYFHLNLFKLSSRGEAPYKCGESSYKVLIIGKSKTLRLFNFRIISTGLQKNNMCYTI